MKYVFVFIILFFNSYSIYADYQIKYAKDNKVLFYNEDDSLYFDRTIYLEYLEYNFIKIIASGSNYVLEYKDLFNDNKSYIIVKSLNELDTLSHVRSLDAYNHIKYSKYINNICHQFNYNFQSEDELVYKCKDVTYYCYNQQNPYNKDYYLLVRNFRNTTIFRYDSNYTFIDTIYNSNSFIYIKKYLNDVFYFTASYNDIFKYYLYKDGKGIETLVDNDKFTELEYIDDDEKSFYAYDSTSYLNLKYLDKNTNTSFFKSHYGYRIYNINEDSIFNYTIINKSTMLTYFIDNDGLISRVDSSYIFENVNNELIKLYKPDSTYIMYRLIVSKNNLNPKKIIFRSYGGYYFQSLFYRPYDSDTELIEKGYALVYSSVSGDGDVSWGVCQNGFKENITNTIDDLHLIVEDVKNKYPDAKRYAWTGSFGSYILFCNSFKYPDDYHKVVLKTGTYDYLLTIKENPHITELLGEPSKEMIEFHNSINPMRNGLNTSNAKFLIINNEYDKLVANSSVLKLLTYFDKNSIEYKFHYMKGHNHYRQELEYEDQNSIQEIELEFYEED